MFSLAPGCRRPPGDVTAWFMTSSARLNWTENQEKKFTSATFLSRFGSGMSALVFSFICCTDYFTVGFSWACLDGHATRYIENVAWHHILHKACSFAILAIFLFCYFYFLFKCICYYFPARHQGLSREITNLYWWPRPTFYTWIVE